MILAVQLIRAACIGAVTALIATTAITRPADAHPHVFVTVQTEILSDAARNVTSFRHSWTFDEFYSSFAVQGMDKNGDGIFDREELTELAEVNVTSLQEFGFFTFPKLGGLDIERLQPKDYWLEHKDGTLTLHFTLPLKEPVPRARLKDFQFAIYDPTMYVGFGYAESAPIHLGAELKGCQPEISKPEAQVPAKSLSETLFSNMDKLTNLGQQYAQNVLVKCGAAS